MPSRHRLARTFGALALLAWSENAAAGRPEPAAAAVTTLATALLVGVAQDLAAAHTPTSAETLELFHRCWKLWNEDWPRLETCYDDEVVSEEPGSGSPPWRGKAAVMGHVQLFKHVFPDAKGELELILVNGRRAAGIVRVTGTHAGTMKRPGGEIAPTHKPLAIPVAHMLELGDSGKSVKELIFLDHASLWGQLGLFPGPHRAGARTSRSQPSIVVARDDDTERRNLEAYERRLERYNARDARGLEAGLAPDMVWSELALPADMDRKAAIAFFEAMWEGFSDLRLSAPSPWAAGPYVVAVGLLEGMNDGSVPALRLDKTGKRLSLPYFEVAKYEKGKLVASWFFYDGLGLATQLGLGPPAVGE